jgi:hypothetical protein
LATAGVLTTPLLNLNICGNVFESSNTSSQTIAVITLENISTVPFMGVSIEDNVFHAENLLMTLWRINGLSIARNFSSAGITITLGKETEAALNAKNVIIDSNSFLNVSDTTGLMTIASVENLTIVNNTFKPKDANIRALLFYGNGVTTTSSNVVITGNLFLKSTSQTIAIGTSGHTYLTPTQNVFDGNIVDSGLSVTFANKNAFDWTPTLTASTPGDLSVAYSTRVGKASITGNTLTASFEVTTTTWTHTTASGVMRISGLPFAVASGISNIGPLAGEGWTLAGVSCLGTRADVGSTNIRFLATRSGAALTSITPSQCPSGTQQTWVGTVSYFI